MVEQRQLAIGEIPMVVTSYETGARPAEVVQFYRQRLTGKRWMTMPGSRVSTPETELIVFSNGEEQLMVNAEAASAEPQATTRVLVNAWRQALPPLPSADPASWSKGQPGQPCPNTPCAGAAQAEQPAAASPPSPVAGQEPFYLPVYPGAVRRMFVATKAGGYWSGAYETEDAVDRVLAFYRKALPNFGWRETKTRELTVPLPSPREMLPPQAPKEAVEQLASMAAGGSLVTTVVLFDGPRGTAAVSVTTVPVVHHTMVALQFHPLRPFSRRSREAAHAAR